MYQKRNSLLFMFIIILILILSTESLRSRTRRNAKKEKNCYEKLAIPTDSSEKQIKKKFRKLAMKYHPDKVKEEEKEEAENIFKELAYCYEILSDKTKRQQYDASGYDDQFDSAGGGAGGTNGGFHFEGNFEDIFSNFFGSGNKFGFNSGPSQSSGFGGGMPGMGDIFGKMGGHQQGAHRTQNNRPNMHSQQQQRRNNPMNSQNKKQKVFVDLENLMDDSFITVNAKKKYGGNRIELEIPSGCPEGHKIIEEGIEFEIYTKLNDDYKRIGKSDISSNISITLEQALLGFDLEIMTLDNEIINEWIDNIPTSKQYKIKRKGLPRYKGDTRGHLYVNFDVKLPILNEKQRENLKKIIQNGELEWDYSEAEKYQKKVEEKRKKKNKRRNQSKTEL